MWLPPTIEEDEEVCVEESESEDEVRSCTCNSPWRTIWLSCNLTALSGFAEGKGEEREREGVSIL